MGGGHNVAPFLFKRIGIRHRISGDLIIVNLNIGELSSKGGRAGKMDHLPPISEINP
jgi:hypothetical protein